MIEELAARTFAARDVAHRQHWKPGTLSQHLALGEFYDGVIEQIDEIVESYQGEFGPIADFQVETSPVPNITTYLQAEKAWIEENRDALAGGSRSLENLIDGLTAIYQRTIFKLTYVL